MATLVKIRNASDWRERYLFEVSEDREITLETDTHLKRVAIEIAKCLAGRVTETDHFAQS